MYERVGRELSERITKQLITLDNQGDEEIRIYINSTGGVVWDMFAICDMMAYVKSPISTIATGVVGSAASVILACGEWGRRLAFPHVSIMYHPTMGGTYGPIEDMEIKVRETRRLESQTNRLLSITYLLAKERD